jgi:hypothetical protein
MYLKGKVVQLRNKEFLKHPADSVFQDGYGQIPKMVMCDKDLNIHAKAIYGYLCSFAGGGNTAFPGIERICEDLQITNKTFQKYFKELEKAGYMKRIHAVTDGNKFYNNIYEFIFKVQKRKKKDKKEGEAIPF